FRPGSRRRIGAELHLAVEQRLGALGIHHQQNEIGGLPAELESDAHALQRIERRGSPLAGVVLTAAADHDAAPIAAADAERAFFDRRQYDDALRFVEQVL